MTHLHVTARRSATGERDRRISRRPNTAPAYYQGRPAFLLINIMKPRRARTAAGHQTGAVA